MYTRFIKIFATLHPMLKVIAPQKDKNYVDNPFKLNVKKTFKKITFSSYIIRMQHLILQLHGGNLDDISQWLNSSFSHRWHIETGHYLH